VLLRTIRQATRRLLRQPGFAITTSLALGLGIGSATIGFSVVEALVLRPLPLEEPDELVVLTEIDSNGRSRGGSPAALQVWRGSTATYSGVAGYRLHDLNLTGQDRPEALLAASVTGEFFPVLRQQASLGRLFAEEEVAGGAPVVVLSHRFWSNRFGGRRDVIGEQLPLGNRSYSIVGVLPSDFRFLEYVPDVMIPLSTQPQNIDALLRSDLPIVIARLQTGVDLKQAIAAASATADELTRRFPEARANWSFGVEGLHSRWMGSTIEPALMMFGAVGVLLLVSCINTAGLVLARSMRRRQEFAVRSALGATRGAIARDFLAEAALFSVFGCAVGLAFATLGLQALIAVLPAEVIGLIPDEAAGLRLNPLAANFAAVVAALTAALCSLSPFLRRTGLSLTDALKSAGRSSSSDGHSMHNLLVAGQVAFSVILLVAGGLLLKGYWTAQQTKIGFDAQGLMTMWIGLSESKYQDETVRTQLYERVTQELGALPQVQAATAIDLLPSHEDQRMAAFAGPQTITSDFSQWPRAAARSIGDSYFVTMGIPFVRGRPFDSRDDANGAPVAIVSSSLAASHFGGNAIGQQIRLGVSAGEPILALIVGIATDVRAPLHRGSTEVVYRPMRQAPPKMIYFLARTNQPQDVSSAAREILWKTDPAQPLDGPWMVDALLTDRLAIHKMSSSMVGVFAASALTLAAFGIFSVVSYLVLSRRKEIGIRLTLGASTASIARLVLARGLGYVVWGVVAGLAATLALSFAIEPYLLDVGRFDLPIYVGVAALVIAVATVACAIPARYASKLDPISTLRLE
jgi:putative ABC transport system permease protein